MLSEEGREEDVSGRVLEKRGGSEGEVKGGGGLFQMEVDSMARRELERTLFSLLLTRRGYRRVKSFAFWRDIFPIMFGPGESASFFSLFRFFCSFFSQGEGEEEEEKRRESVGRRGKENEKARTVFSRSPASCSPYPAFNRSRSELSVLSRLRSCTQTHQRLCRSSHDLCRSSSTVHARPVAEGVRICQLSFASSSFLYDYFTVGGEILVLI